MLAVRPDVNGMWLFERGIIEFPTITTIYEIQQYAKHIWILSDGDIIGIS